MIGGDAGRRILELVRKEFLQIRRDPRLWRIVLIAPIFRIARPIAASTTANCFLSRTMLRITGASASSFAASSSSIRSRPSGSLSSSSASSIAEPS